MLQNKILYFLEKNKDEIVTGGTLAKQFNVSRTAIWKAIKALQENGNKIISFPNSGYKLLKNSDGLSKNIIIDNLNTKKIGKILDIFDTIDSTNQYLKLQNNFDDGYTIVANEQTSGKGRRDRIFYSLKNQGVYMSIYLKPQIDLKDITFITICTAVSVCKAIENICNFKVDIKWVNDIFYNNKKLGGILTEGVISAEIGSVESIIVGIGINTGDIANEVNNIAVSTKEFGIEHGIRNQLVSEILNQFEEIYFNFISGNKTYIIEEYTKRLFIINKEVTISQTNNKYKAHVIGVNELGELLVKDSENKIIAINTGEVIC